MHPKFSHMIIGFQFSGGWKINYFTRQLVYFFSIKIKRKEKTSNYSISYRGVEKGWIRGYWPNGFIICGLISIWVYGWIFIYNISNYCAFWISYNGPSWCYNWNSCATRYNGNHEFLLVVCYLFICLWH